MKNTSIDMKRILFASLFAVLVFSFTACEDEPPNAYVPEPFVQGWLMVNEPIENIAVMISQPLTEPFSYTAGIVPDADVVIRSGSEVYQLDYREVDGLGQYYYPDQNFLVAPNTTYELEVTMPDGQVLTAETTTPAMIEWTIAPKPIIPYPQDTVNLPTFDSLDIAWTPSNVSEYLIQVRVLDTLGYGTYLTPQTDEVNGRTNNLDFFEDPETPTFYENSRWGFLQATKVATVWTAFRWYGRNDVVIYAPDKAMLDWFKVTQFRQNAEYEYQFSNITGGLGVFGSASRAVQEVFLLKNK